MLKSIGLPELLILTIVGILGAGLFTVIPAWKIFSKAGYSGALSLLMFFPVLNIAVWFFLAFSDWPVLQELRSARQNAGQPR